MNRNIIQLEQLQYEEEEDGEIFQQNSEENSDNQQQEFDEDEEIRIQEENLEEEEKNLEINDFQNQAEGLLLSEQPIGFKQPLMDYQLQAITWMQYREGALSFEAAKKYNTQKNVVNIKFY
ncbi:hypothetical protein PPERSA_02081 [Pseudocohnilembus persalinus]|uniref:Uncharacterized protein n=1 Tax=Pseudocohnilembus persalinus TaxID=266149 RepID=A0A0V0Q7W2_PSEPJ|nr:hypothetical protein PPERSA_02081 [Pseudocohnilembus persalinus]|eukprot:KRW98304.1 hypothetical protein PPERSA_02081 [Pseudocohnilembus persalinus]